MMLSIFFAEECVSRKVIVCTTNGKEHAGLLVTAALPLRGCKTLDMDGLTRRGNRNGPGCLKQLGKVPGILWPGKC